MSAYADASFLFALYRQQPGNEAAVEWMTTSREQPIVTALLIFEFQQAVRFEIFRRSRDHTKGFSELDGLNILAQFEAHQANGVFAVADFDAARVLEEASRLSERHTIRHGVRAFDILHVATALVVGAEELLTFDVGQGALAETEGLRVLL